jgi:hypothetical protein
MFDFLVVYGEEFSFTLNNHGFSIVLTMDGVSAEGVTNVLYMGSFQVYVYLWSISDTRQEIGIELSNSFNVNKTVNVSIAAIISIAGQKLSTVRMDPVFKQITLMGAGCTLELSLESADVVWIGNPDTIHTNRWTQGIELVRNESETAISFAWLNLTIPSSSSRSFILTATTLIGTDGRPARTARPPVTIRNQLPASKPSRSITSPVWIPAR